MNPPFKVVNFIGEDARTSAMVWHVINHSPEVGEINVAPGNAGISLMRLRNGKSVTCIPIAVRNITTHRQLARERKADVTIVSPELPLTLDAAGVFEHSGLKLFGCSRLASQFESSKCFAQKFAQKHFVRFAPGECFTDAESAKALARNLKGQCAVKADGLRNGKGVEICHSVPESDAAIDAEFKTPGAKIVIQQLLKGDEVSLMLFCDGETVKLCETARDYKRALEGDFGDQTGGMGAFSSKPLLSEAQLAEVSKTIIEPWLQGCQTDGIFFRGVLYIGLMVTKDGIFALEFNVRLGDPETEVLLPRLENDLLEIVDACLSGTLDDVKLHFKPIHSLCVVMASFGYPKQPESGKVIYGLEECRAQNLQVFHYDTKEKNHQILTPAGRALAVTGWSDKDLRDAAELVYGTIDQHLRFDGAQFRPDIGKSVWGNP